jgi:hypothetical protein
VISLDGDDDEGNHLAGEVATRLGPDNPFLRWDAEEACWRYLSKAWVEVLYVGNLLVPDHHQVVDIGSSQVTGRNRYTQSG